MLEYNSTPVGVVASCLVYSTLDWANWVQALARDTVLCSKARRLALTVLLSTQVYKWVPANLMLVGDGGNPEMDYYPIQGESRNTPSCFMLQKPEPATPAQISLS